MAMLLVICCSGPPRPDCVKLSAVTSPLLLVVISLLLFWVMSKLMIVAAIPVSVSLPVSAALTWPLFFDGDAAGNLVALS